MVLYSLPNRYCYSGECLSVFYLGQYVNRSYHSPLPRKYFDCYLTLVFTGQRNSRNTWNV